MPRKRREDTRSVYDKALGLLARREHSARELKTKIAQRGHDAGEADAAIDRLQGQHYQDDGRFAGALARRRAAQGYGPRRIAAELKTHGLDDAAIRIAIATVEADWPSMASSQLRRHYGDAVAASFDERARRAAFLLRRGFDPATVSAVTRAEVDGPDQDFD